MSKNSVQVNLPARVQVADYHEFPFLQDNLRKIIPGIKVFEVGCTGKYDGIAYIGRKDQPEVKALVKEIKSEVEIGK